MKIPRKPPNIKELEKKLSIKTLQTGIATEKEGKYRHWDILRHLTPPKGFSREEWWYAIKVHRMSLMKTIPLKDQKGNFFSYSIPEFVQEQLHTIDLGASSETKIPSPIANSHTRNQYLIRSLIEEAITSSQLEGAATTRKVAKEMLKTGRPPRDKNEQMIFNNFQVMQKIREWKDLPLSKELIFEIHRMVTHETLDKADGAGRFRLESENVTIEDLATRETLHEPPKASELEERMEAMCHFANGSTPDHFIHPIIRAIILHFWLAFDHPFVDGNGRTARALFYYLMLREGYWLFEYISISEIILKAPAQYGKAFLYTETDDNDLTYFIIHESHIIERAFKCLEEFAEKQIQKLENLSIKNLGDFNQRQEALLVHARKHPHILYTIEGHRLSHAIAYDTARTDLLELHKKGLLTMQKKGKAYIFKPHEDLFQRTL